MPQDDKKIWSPHDRNAGAWIEHDDSLYCAAYSSVASLNVSFAGYFRKANGEILRYEIDVLPTSDRAITAKQQNFGAGFLLSCAAYLKSGNANRGQCYVRAGIRKSSGTPLVVLSQVLGGYVSDDFSPSFPHGKIEGPLEGPGYLRVGTQAAPAVATGFSVPVPTGALWRLISLEAALATDGNAGNRLVNLQINDGTNAYAILPAAVLQAASLTYDYSFSAVGFAPATNASYQIVAVPADIKVQAGGELFAAISGVKAGDQWSAPVYAVEEWIEA